jgi:hypothetical protein
MRGTRHPSGCRYARALGALFVCALVLAGCRNFAPTRYNPPQFGFGPPLPQVNPIVVTAMDREMVWEGVADVVDDYFKIAHEERVKLVGDMLTEGRIDTYPRGGSTIFEPWNSDSATPYERLESTLQSIRRTALVRVIPDPAGFRIEVQVMKELENVPRPETGAVSLANPAALRNDDSLIRVTSPVAGQQPNIGWIPMGRDLALEQEMLAQIQARLGGVVVPAFAPPPQGEPIVTPPAQF